MRERMEYDYGEAFLTDAQFVSARIEPAQAYVAYVETLIPKAGTRLFQTPILNFLATKIPARRTLRSCKTT